jgi:hypothetical protein
VFRVFPTKAKPKLGTITDPFIGTVKTFESSLLTSALREIIPGLRLRVNPPQLIRLESAGPNGFKSSWSSSLDALAFDLSDLRILYSYFHKVGGQKFW